MKVDEVNCTLTRSGLSGRRTVINQAPGQIGPRTFAASISSPVARLRNLCHAGLTGK